MQNLFLNADGKPKTFWERPEGVTGQIVGVAILAGLGWGLYTALPYIIILLQNAIYATVLGVAAVALGFVVTDKKFWNLGKHLYMSAMRGITQAFVEIDPIGVILNIIDEMEGKLAGIAKGIKGVSSKIEECKAEIRANNDNKNNQLELMSAAKKQNKTMVLVLASREATRMEEANISYEDMLRTMENMHTKLIKVQEAVTFIIMDMKSEVKVKKRKREFMKQAVSVVRLAQSIMKGEPSQLMMFDLANEALASDLASKLGEINEFTRMAESMLDSVDLRNGIYEAKGMELLEEWESRAENLMKTNLRLENSKQPVLPVTGLETSGKYSVSTEKLP